MLHRVTIGNPSATTRPGPVRILSGACALGVAALLTQVVLAREALAAAAGHELMFGVALSGWLLGQLTCLILLWGAGQQLSPTLALLLAGLAAPLSLVILRLAIAQATPADGMLPTLLAAVPAIGAGCLPAALGLALAFSSIYHHARGSFGDQALWRVYAAETLGFLVGGLSWTFLLADHVSHVQVLALLPGVMLLYGAFTSPRHRAWLATGGCLLLLTGWLLTPAADRWLAPGLPAGLTQVAFKDGRRARWQVAEYAGEYSFYRNGRLTGSTGQPATAAQLVLLPLAEALPAPATGGPQTPPAPIDVLHIGLRHPGSAEYLAGIDGVAVTWLDGDPDYVQLLAKYSATPPAPAERAAPLAMLASRGDGDGWELVILALGPPSSPAVAWAYDHGFLERIRHGLARDGVLALSLEAEANYNADTLRLVHDQVRANLAAVFPKLLVTPPAPVWYFAGGSQASLTLDPVEIEQRLTAVGITEPCLSRYVLADRLDPQRAAGWQQPPDEALHLRQSPLALAGLRMELTGNDPRLATALSTLLANRIWLGIAAAALLLLPVLLTRRAATPPAPPALSSLALACYAGFTCLAAEVILAWLLQALLGQLYWLLALLTSLVLGGLFVGNLLAGCSWLTPRRAYGALSLLLVGLVVLAVHGNYDWPSLVALWSLAFLIPTATGLILGLALRTTGSSPLWLYAADLFGAAVAALLVGTVGLLAFGASWCILPLVVLWLIITVHVPRIAGYNASSS